MQVRASLVVTAAAAILASAPAAALEFTHGVASGEVTPVSAGLWTRVNGAAALRVTVERISPGPGPKKLMRSVSATAGSDFTARVLVAPLTPDATYQYQFQGEGTVSQVGTFRTAPLPSVAKSLRFAFSGNSDGTKLGGVPFFNAFEPLDAARAEAPDFFIYHGDIIYSDSGVRTLRGQGPAMTLQAYRDAHKETRAT